MEKVVAQALEKGLETAIKFIEDERLNAIRTIYLSIVGHRHYENPINDGDFVMLVRESDNALDPNAIGVVTEMKTYTTRKIAAYVSNSSYTTMPGTISADELVKIMDTRSLTTVEGTIIKKEYYGDNLYWCAVNI